jgi:biotin carboxyl carrier protein
MNQTFLIDGVEEQVFIVNKNDDQITLKFNDQEYCFKVKRNVGTATYVEYKGKLIKIDTVDISGAKQVFALGKSMMISKKSLKRSSSEVNLEGSLISPMPGKIFKVLKSAGEEVIKGETVLILEAMKMEHPIKATNDGVIKKILFNEGELVSGGVQLVELDV